MSKAKSRHPTLDLHGRKKDEVFDLVDRFVMKNQNKDKIRIMTGKGTGAVQSVVIDYLKKGHFPWEYETLPSGAKNTGCLIVFLD